MALLYTRKVIVLGVSAIAWFSAISLQSPVSALESPRDLPRPSARVLPIVTIEARAYGRPVGEIQKLITTAAAYRGLLGTEPPENLDFSREWVAFYAAGTLPTGGYSAHISRVSAASGGLLLIETRLVSPGPNCLVTQALTNPYVVVRFPKPEHATRAIFDHEVVVKDCL